MPNFISQTVIALSALLALGGLQVAVAEDGKCVDRYFAENGSPRAAPSRELAATVKLANGGDAKEQRNLAISYEAGYLVAKCPAKAAYWYQKAADGGDEPARKWLSRHNQFAQLQASGECLGGQCRRGGDGARSVSLVAGAHGHFYAPVTINGITEIGMIDTGATSVAMSEESARRFGIDLRGGIKGKAQTASGVVDTTNVTLPAMTVSGISLPNVRVAVGIQGSMLIGMSFLSRLEMKTGAGVLMLSK